MSTATLAVKGPDLPEPVARRGITEAQWRTLVGSLYPGAHSASVLMVWDYCAARHLDPLKKPCHIVPMEVKNAATGKYEWRDVVMQGIYEIRTTAQRTGQYLGHSRPEYGPEIDAKGVKAPEWAEFTVYRWNDNAGQRVEFPVRVYFREVVAVTKDGKPNSRWSRAPIQMLTKCLEAAGLREAFPDEIGGDQTAEEMEGQRAIDVTASVQADAPVLVKPDGFDEWLDDMRATADEGEAPFATAWKDSLPAHREYLVQTEPGLLESLKAKAAQHAEPGA